MAAAGIHRAALAALLAALPLAGCDYLRPFEKVCEKRLGPASIAVDLVPLSYATDFSLSAAKLSAKGAPAAGQITLGYIESQLKSTVSFGGSGVVHPLTRRYCVRPDVKVKLSFAPTTLYVAREQTQGSCEFRITIDHELKHFREYQIFLADLGESTQKDLREKFDDRIFYFDSAAAGQKRIEELARTTLAPYMESGMAEVMRRQAKLDTPAEYYRLDRMQAACGG